MTEYQPLPGNVPPVLESRLGNASIQFANFQELARDWTGLTAGPAIMHTSGPDNNTPFLDITASVRSRRSTGDVNRLGLAATISLLPNSRLSPVNGHYLMNTLRSLHGKSLGSPDIMMNTYKQLHGQEHQMGPGVFVQIDTLNVGGQDLYVRYQTGGSYGGLSILNCSPGQASLHSESEVESSIMHAPTVESSEDLSKRFDEFARALMFIRGYCASFIGNPIFEQSTIGPLARISGELKQNRIISQVLKYKDLDDTLSFSYKQPEYIRVERARKVQEVARRLGEIEVQEAANTATNLAFFSGPKVRRTARITKPEQQIQTPEWDSSSYLSEVVEVWEPRFSLDDIGGLEHIKKEINDIATLFNHPADVEEWGITRPKGILFHGEPGNGKTMLAHALAKRTESVLWEVDSAKLFDMWLGLASKNVSKLFDDITAYKGRLVVFFDEIDSILSIQETGPGGAAAERNQVTGIFKRRLNTLSEEKDDLLIVAATNRLDRLDPAIIRDGRFDYKIYVPMPDELGRGQIITTHIAELVLRERADQSGFQVPDLAKATGGMSGAAIQNIFERLRRRKAIKQIQSGEKQTVTQQDVLEEIKNYKTFG